MSIPMKGYAAFWPVNGRTNIGNYFAGMAELYASAVAMKTALSVVRIHGGYGCSTESDVERYFRDAPLMIVGEGTNAP